MAWRANLYFRACALTHLSVACKFGELPRARAPPRNQLNKRIILRNDNGRESACKRPSILLLTKLLHCYKVRRCPFAVCSITRVQTKVARIFRCQRKRAYIMRRADFIVYRSAIFKPGEVRQGIGIYRALQSRHVVNP